MSSPQRGDVIFTSRLGYNHYGIYVSDAEVIHYCKDSKGNFIDDIKNTITCNGVIDKTSLSTFLNGDKLYICNFNAATVNNLWKSGLLIGGLALLASNPLVAGAALAGKVLLGVNVLKKANDFIDNDSEKNRSAKKVFSPEETVARARAEQGKGGYNLVVHNCEHFAIWCKTGVSSSEQVKKIMKMVSPIPI